MLGATATLQVSPEWQKIKSVFSWHRIEPLPRPVTFFVWHGRIEKSVSHSGVVSLKMSPKGRSLNFAIDLMSERKHADYGSAVCGRY
jgi:hypothetical protein